MPDDVHPKTKMMYAAARDDTKRALDPARFSHDYHVVETEDVTAAAFAEWSDRRRETAMSAQELRAAAAKAGSPDVLSLWAGQSVRLARKGAAADITRDLWRDAQACLRATAARFAASP